MEVYFLLIQQAIVGVLVGGQLCIFNLQPQCCPAWGHPRKWAWEVHKRFASSRPRVMQITAAHIPFPRTESCDPIKLQGSLGNICVLRRKRKWALVNTFSEKSEQLKCLFSRGQDNSWRLVLRAPEGFCVERHCWAPVFWNLSWSCDC